MKRKKKNKLKLLSDTDWNLLQKRSRNFTPFFPREYSDGKVSDIFSRSELRIITIVVIYNGRNLLAVAWSNETTISVALEAIRF